VEKLWTAGANPVEKLTTKKYLWPDRGEDLTSRHVDAIFAGRFA
jgi:hypothetical protein